MATCKQCKMKDERIERLIASNERLRKHLVDMMRRMRAHDPADPIRRN